MEEPLYPLARGDFVIRECDERVARVRSIWWDQFEQEFVMNLSYYEHNGDEPGRVSAALGGPRDFEPAITFNDEWKRIEPPLFPVRVDLKWVGEGATQTAQRVVNVEVIPFRALKRKEKKRKWTSPAPVKSDFNADLEASSLRMAAQTLRDTAKTIPDSAAALIERAEAMEKEAEAIQPRTIY
jgi:hypothetical protein